MRVLAVDDEVDILRILTLGLVAEGIDVVRAQKVDDAMRILDQDPDLTAVILDIDLSAGATNKERSDEGFDLLRYIRASSGMPVIMLSATDREIVKVQALELGADDYVTKPFGSREIAARLGAILRRRGEVDAKRTFSFGSLRLDPGRRKLERDGELIDLTPIEFEILVALVRAGGRVLSRREIVEAVWGSEHFGDERTVDVHVRHLRQKMEDDPSHPRFVKTVRKAGYRFPRSTEL